MPALLRIDFAVAGAGGGWGPRGLLVGGVLAAVAVVVAFFEVRSTLAEIELQVRSSARLVAASVRPVSADPAQLRALSARITASNRVLDALDQPWLRLFEEIEGAATEGIALLALEPDATQATVRLSGEAQDLHTLAAYLERLGALASLREVRITQHELRDASARLLLRFTIAARWVRSP